MPEAHPDIREAIERTRSELSARLDALSESVDVRARASDTVDEGRKIVKASGRKARRSAEKAAAKAKVTAGKTAGRATRATVQALPTDTVSAKVGDVRRSGRKARAEAAKRAAAPARRIKGPSPVDTPASAKKHRGRRLALLGAVAGAVAVANSRRRH